jgi:hypothetical protein
MDNEKFSRLMYALTKHAANYDFTEFLDMWELTLEEYGEIRDYLKETYGIKPYL